MLLSFRRRQTSPKPSSKTPTVEPITSLSKPAEPGLQHLDYNRQPLNVERLSHYIEPVMDEERFRVH